MGKLSGTVLILAGVSIAAYTLSAQQNAGPRPAAEATVEPAATFVTAENATQAAPPPAASAPGAAPTPADTPSSVPAVTPSPPQLEAPPSPPPATGAPYPVAPQKLRPGAPAAVRVAEAPPRLPVGETAATAAPPLDRASLTREIQRQLKRIGCYQGDVSGVWSPAVRQALKTVTDRVNASLPIDQPDPVLLAMVQSQEPGSCTSCPNGQSRVADGRCLPAALVASAGKHQTPTAGTGAKSAKAGAAPADGIPAARPETASPPPAEGRMSLAGPRTETPRQARARARGSREMPGTQRAAAYYRPPGPRTRQRSAQRPAAPFWAVPFLLP
jgi:hypothetical protein